MKGTTPLTALEVVIAEAVHAAVADALADHRPDPRPVAYTVAQVAELLSVSRQTVRDLIASGDLWTVPLGASRTLRIPAAALDELCRRREQVAR